VVITQFGGGEGAATRHARGDSALPDKSAGAEAGRSAPLTKSVGARWWRRSDPA
jgi:hypothetical protein